MKNGTSLVRNDGRIEYMIKGTVNGVEGVYHTTVRNGNYVTHKNFMPKTEWARYAIKNQLPSYNEIK